MAQDWVKVRTSLSRDPKTIRMAEFLNSSESPLSRHVCHMTMRDSNVTDNVMRNAVCGALVTVWGTVRHQSKRVGDDARLSKSSIQAVDILADMPGFGDAMALVGWVEEDAEDLVFPAFFRRNEQPNRQRED